MKRLVSGLSIFVLGLMISSCATGNSSITPDSTVRFIVIDCPEEIRAKAVSYGKRYLERDTVYEWGGQDMLEKEGELKLDCSGFIVNVFQYAVADTKYTLLFKDTTVGGLFENFTISIDTPTPGDFIFMGADPNAPTHMGIYLRTDEENIYFMDATQKDAEGIYPAVDGATERNYPKDDPRFLSYARLLIKY
ncbi:MAG: C40 family peptidase [Treponema sp.]|jgi:hypothetical protein|nr:C40 family peptidase [Treponema sp.]